MLGDLCLDYYRFAKWVLVVVILGNHSSTSNNLFLVHAGNSTGWTEAWKCIIHTLDWAMGVWQCAWLDACFQVHSNLNHLNNSSQAMHKNAYANKSPRLFALSIIQIFLAWSQLVRIIQAELYLVCILCTINDVFLAPPDVKRLSWLECVFVKHLS